MDLLTYVGAIARGFPGVRYKATGNGSVYEDIVWGGGNPMPSKEELDVYIASQAKVDMWECIKDKRTEVQRGGVKVGAYWFHSDMESKIQQLGLLLFGANMPLGIMWKTMSGAFVEMTPQLAQQIFAASAMHDITAFAVAENHKAQMLVSPEPHNYDYSSGWPATYNA